MQSEIGSVDFYQNVSVYPLKAPIISTDDCSITVSCEADYSLVVFDTDKFGKYSADGFCDSFTQTWKIDKDGSESFTTFKTLRGLCVDYSPPKTTNCMSCPLDVFPPPPPESEGKTQSFKELDPVDGCRRLYIECTRVVPISTDVFCDPIKIMDFKNVTRVEETSTPELATTILTCSNDGTYYYKETKNIAGVYCNYPRCYKMW